MQLKHIKHVRSKGKDYYYFDTGRIEDGKRIFTPLPNIKDPDFARSYAACMGHRNRDKRERADSLTIPHLVDLFQKSGDYRKKAPATRRLYDTYLQQLCDKLPTAPAALLEQKDVYLLIDAMADRPGAANMLLASMSAMYRWAIPRHLRENPCVGVKPFTVGEHEPWPDALLLAGLETDQANVRLLVHLLYYTAQRIGDVLAMTWASVENDRLVLRQQKTGKDLTIPLHRALRAELARTPRKGLVIVTTQAGKPMAQKTAREILQRFAEKRGFKIVPHGLRKNAVNELLLAGCSVAETAAISGQTLKMVEHYAKRRDQTKLASAAVLAWERNG